MKRTNVPHLLKTLGYFESLVSINLLSVLLIVLDETVKRSANKQENLRLFLKKKNASFLEEIKKPVIHKFLNDFITTERRLTDWYYLLIEISIDFIHALTADEAF